MDWAQAALRRYVVLSLLNEHQYLMAPLNRYAEYLPERPIIGYGMDQPDPQWPDGAKIAISFVSFLPFPYAC